MKVEGEDCIPDSLHHFVSSIFYYFMFPCPSEEDILSAKLEGVRRGHSTFLWTDSLGKPLTVFHMPLMGWVSSAYL